MVRIDYTPRTTRSGDVVWTPIVEALFIGEHSFNVQLILDTGASRTQLPAARAADIGVDIADCGDPLSMDWGAGYRDDVWEIPGVWHVQVAGQVAPIRPMLGKLPIPVLGMDFMESFAVTFHGEGRYLELVPLYLVAPS